MLIVGITFDKTLLAPLVTYLVNYLTRNTIRHECINNLLNECIFGDELAKKN